MNHLPRAESQELWPSAASPYLLLGDVSGKAKATNFHRLSAIWNLVDFEFCIQPGISFARSLGLRTRSCLELRRNNHLRNSWHHWLTCVRHTLGLHAEHAVGFMWSGIFIRSASCVAQWTCDAVSVPGKLAAFLHTNVSTRVSKSAYHCLSCARGQYLRLQRSQHLQRSRSSAHRRMKSRKEDRGQESRIRSKDERSRHLGCPSRHEESSAGREGKEVSTRSKESKGSKSLQMLWVISTYLSCNFYPDVVYRVVSGLLKYGPWTKIEPAAVWTLKISINQNPKNNTSEIGH